MLGNRLLILLGGCLLASSAAWADGVGYIDCRNHPEDTDVFAKPRKTPDSVGSIRCGDRFYILQYGFIFSRIQTGDGKVGYIYSNLIAVDTSGVVQRSAPTQPQPQPAPVQAAPAQAPAPAQPLPTKVPAPVAQPSTAKVAAPDAHSTSQPVPSQSPSTTAAANKATASNVAAKPAAAASGAAANSTPASALNVVVNPETGAPASNLATSAPASKPDKSAETPSAANPAAPKVQDKPYVPASTAEARSNVSEKRPNDTHANRDASAAASDTRTQPTSTPSVSAQISVTTSNTPDTSASATATQPDTTPRTDSEPPPAEPSAPPIRSAKDSWERPNPGGRHAPLLELFGGYSFARMVSAGTTTNLSGGLGSVGWNITSWLQLVADSSYNIVTASGARNVLYGNHWGPRVFHRGRNRWNASPFVEALFGGSRSDTTVAGTKTSVTTFSIKAGGGLDIKPSRHFEIRLIDVDYYRTNFGGAVYQNNYFASAGIVLRLFGGGEE